LREKSIEEGESERIQSEEPWEVGELRWDRASELIRVEIPERATMNKSENTQI